MSSTKTKDKERLLGLLWEEFMAKADLKWRIKHEKTADKKSTPPHQQLAELMITDMKTSNASCSSWNSKELSAAFKRKGLLLKTTKVALDQLSRYLGYRHWQHFRESHPKPTELDNKTDSPIQRDGSDLNIWGP